MIIRKEGLSAEEHEMLNEFEVDLAAWLRQQGVDSTPKDEGAESEDEWFWEFDEENA